MSADLLREAAEVLRERAEDANPDPWRADRNAVRTGRDALALTYDIHFGNDTDQTSKDATYIATMHPGVGLALADWLELAANGACCDECMTDPAADPLRAAALVTARKILGRAS
jgi:hypothetical protein